MEDSILICRDVDSVDGWWGSLVNKTTNAFNGMIGMVQRRVKFVSAKTCQSINILITKGSEFGNGIDNSNPN